MTATLHKTPPPQNISPGGMKKQRTRLEDIITQVSYEEQCSEEEETLQYGHSDAVIDVDDDLDTIDEDAEMPPMQRAGRKRLNPIEYFLQRFFFCCAPRSVSNGEAVPVGPPNASSSTRKLNTAAIPKSTMNKVKKRRKKEPSFTNLFKSSTNGSPGSSSIRASSSVDDDEDDDELILMQSHHNANDDNSDFSSQVAPPHRSPLLKTTKKKSTTKKLVIRQTQHSQYSYSTDSDQDDDNLSHPVPIVEPYHLLGPQRKDLRRRKTLVLDLDETLVHSSFRKVPYADIIVHVEIEDLVNPVYVLKRPGVDAFLRAAGELFEVVVFTASLSKYANPLLDQLDKEGVIHHRLFREHCTFVGGAYKKDLSLLGRDVSQCVIIDNSPVCYDLQPQNAIAVTSWFDDRNDQELHSLLPWLHKIAEEKEVYGVLSELSSWRHRMI